MAGLFERDPEARSESVDIVCHRLCFTQERFVGHKVCSREIVGKLDMTTRETCSYGDFATGGQLIEEILKLDQAQHMSELEEYIGVVERLGQIDDAVFLIIDPQRLCHLLCGAPLDANAVRVEKSRLKCGIDVVWLVGLHRGQCLGREFEIVEVV